MAFCEMLFSGPHGRITRSAHGCILAITLGNHPSDQDNCPMIFVV